MNEQHGPEADGARQGRVVRLRFFLTLALWAIALGLFLYFFQAAKVILLGVLAAACVAAALRPLMRYVPGPRGLSALVVGIAPILLLVGAVVLLSWLLARPIQREVQRWPEIERKVNDVLAGWSRNLGLDQPITVDAAVQELGGFFTGSSGTQVISTTASILSGTAIALIFVFFGSIYLLVEPPERLVRPVLDALPAERRGQVRGALDDLVPRLRWWVIGTLVSMTLVGLASWAGFALAGLEFAVPLALLAGVAEIVPTVGPAAAFLVALLFAATQGTGTMIAVVVVYCIVQVLESYVILPWVMKKAVKIPPVVTLFTVVLWGKVFGIAGLLLAVPINLVLWSFYDHLVLRAGRRVAVDEVG